MAPTRARGATVRRIYDPPGRGEGYRALVDRLWPRGVKREPGLFDDWLKDAAPTTDLRRWYGHDPEKYAVFARRYRAELKEEPASDVVASLRTRAARGRVTLLTATRDVDHSGARVLADVVNGAV
jgi:uncharacterized protein YeaO (DUF488 family)